MNDGLRQTVRKGNHGRMCRFAAMHAIADLSEELRIPRIGLKLLCPVAVLHGDEQDEPSVERGSEIGQAFHRPSQQQVGLAEPIARLPTAFERHSAHLQNILQHAGLTSPSPAALSCVGQGNIVWTVRDRGHMVKLGNIGRIVPQRKVELPQKIGRGQEGWLSLLEIL